MSLTSKVNKGTDGKCPWVCVLESIGRESWQVEIDSAFLIPPACSYSSVYSKKEAHNVSYVWYVRS